MTTSQQGDLAAGISAEYLKLESVYSCQTGVNQKARRQRLLATFTYEATSNIVYTTIAAKTANSGAIAGAAASAITAAAKATLPASVVAGLDESSFSTACASCTSGASSVALGAVLGFSAVFAALM